MKGFNPIAKWKPLNLPRFLFSIKWGGCSRERLRIEVLGIHNMLSGQKCVESVIVVFVATYHRLHHVDVLRISRNPFLLDFNSPFFVPRCPVTNSGHCFPPGLKDSSKKASGTAFSIFFCDPIRMLSCCLDLSCLIRTQLKVGKIKSSSFFYSKELSFIGLPLIALK